MKNLILLICFISFSQLMAQNFKFAGIDYNYYPKSTIESEQGNSEIFFNETNLFLNIPIRLAHQKIILLNGLQYSLAQANISNSPFFKGATYNKSIHKLAYGLTMVYKLTDKWNLIGKVKPTLATGFDQKLSSDDFIFQGSLMVSYKINDHSNLGAGAVYTTQTGEPRFLPTLLFKYKKGRQLIDVLLPSRLKYLIQVDKNGHFSAGIKGSFDGGQYSVRLEDFIGTNPDFIQKLVFTRVNFGPILNYQISEKMQLELSGGITVARRYEFQDIENAVHLSNAENGNFIGLSLYMFK